MLLQLARIKGPSPTFERALRIVTLVPSRALFRTQARKLGWRAPPASSRFRSSRTSSWTGCAPSASRS